MAWLRQLRLSWDFMANSWNQWVLGYTQERQQWLLSRVGIDNATWQKLTALLFVLAGVIIVAFTVLLARQLKGRKPDPVLAAYTRFCESLRRRGLPRRPEEGPVDFARRLERVRPDLTPAIAAITRLYVALRYGIGSDAAALRELQLRVRQFYA